MAQGQEIGTVDVVAGEVLSRFSVLHNGAHEGAILAAAFAPDGTRVANRRRQRGAADLGRRYRCSDRRSVLRVWGPDGLVAGRHLAPVGGHDRHPGQQREPPERSPG